MNDSTSLTMPVQPMYGGGNGGFGGAWGSDIWLILIILFACGGWGNGFGGGFGGYGNMMLGYDFPWLLNGQNQINANTNNGFRDQMINSGINGLQNSITSGFGDVQTALCGGFAGVNASINGAQSAITQQMYANQIADMQTAFAAQNAMNQGFNSLGMNLQNCCCEQRAGIADVKYTLATEACATRNTDTQNTQSILNTINGGIQSIKDQLCQDKIDAKNDTISQLRSELLYARGQASQDVQTAAIQAGQRALANEVEQYVAPKAIPAYIVQNPSCCNQNYNCGCGSF